MLVLSRRPNEKILLPAINTTIQVVSTARGVVRLGIEAPPEVRVLREELARRDGPAPAPPAPTLRHEVRNRLNTATIGLALLRQQLRHGRGADVEATLGKIEEEVEQLRRRLEDALAPAPPPSPPGPPRRCKALVVEDDPNECELLAGFLRFAGVEVATAGDGADALDYLRGHGRPDVVLLDMALPRCDGPATIRAIRQDPAQAGLKIFAITGHALEPFQRATEGAGVTRWFSKPINPEALLRELRRQAGPAPASGRR
jgi:carbon storage regulator CsrA